jgi:hypothetical protein
MTPEQFQQMLNVLTEINSSLRIIATAKNDKFQTGFDSKLAPKIVNIERGGEDGNSCLSCDGKPLPYRSITGILERISLEHGKSADYGEYTLVFAWFNTDAGLIGLKCGMMPKPSVSLRNLLFGLAQLKPGSQVVTLEFTPNQGTSEREKKIVNIKLRDATGNEISTAFPKEKGTDRDTSEIQAYWEEKLITVTANFNEPSQFPQPVNNNASATSLPKAKQESPDVQLDPNNKPKLYPKQNALIRTIRTRTGHTSDQIVSWCNKHGAVEPSQLEPEVCKHLAKTLAIGWGKSNFDSLELCTTSYEGKVNTLVAAGMKLEDAIAQWMDSVENVPSLT